MLPLEEHSGVLPSSVSIFLLDKHMQSMPMVVLPLSLFSLEGCIPPNDPAIGKCGIELLSQNAFRTQFFKVMSLFFYLNFCNESLFCKCGFFFPKILFI